MSKEPAAFMLSVTGSGYRLFRETPRPHVFPDPGAGPGLGVRLQRRADAEVVEHR